MSNEKEPLDLNNISTILIGSLKDHILIQGVVFLSKGTITSFQETEQAPRFLLRDAFLLKHCQIALFLFTTIKTKQKIILKKLKKAMTPYRVKYVFLSIRNGYWTL